MPRAPPEVSLSRVIPSYIYSVPIFAVSFTMAVLDLDSDSWEDKEQIT